MARRWAGEFLPMLFTDSGVGMAGEELARQVCGEAVGLNRGKLVGVADIVVLGHEAANKPNEVAVELASAKGGDHAAGGNLQGKGRRCVSASQVSRVMPYLGVEGQEGRPCAAGGEERRGSRRSL